MPAAALWICCWTYFNFAGWLLSAIHAVNTVGYTIALVPAGVMVAIWTRDHRPTFKISKWARRFRRPLPAAFLLLALLILAGGALYAPTNYDALTYRLPRMLNWLANGKWGWILAVNQRANYSGTGWEWVGTPLLVLTHSDRLLFLIGYSGFLLMPGLLFSIFRQLGIARRVAFTWMWVLPLAYGYATQAGGIGNDLSGAVLFLCSIFHGLRARKSRRVEDVCLALLAAAAMTAVKMSNLPLVLPCAVAVWPALNVFRTRLFAVTIALMAAVAASAVPIMVLNQIHTGSWTGDPHDKYKMQVKNPAAALLGNSVLLAEGTFMPPVLPAAHHVKESVEHVLPDPLWKLLQQDYPRFIDVTLTEVPTEEGAGTGLGITILLLAGIALSFSRDKSGFSISRSALILIAAAWIAALVYMLKMGSEAACRLMLPFYPLMIVPFLFLPGQKRLVASCIGRAMALLPALFILPALILSPARPLWPGQTVCQALARQYPGNPVLERMTTVYSTYAHRNDLLAPLREKLPADAHKIGFVAGSNDTDYSLWRPFGQRSVVYPGHDASEFQAKPREIEWLVVKDNNWPNISNVPLTDWAATNRFRLLFATNIVELVAWGPERWSLWQRQN